jgi:hypothetical protein
MRNALFVILAFMVFAVTDAAAQTAVPVLRYTPPANAFRGGTGLSDDYSFNCCDASVQVYPFRPFNAEPNIWLLFRDTLLRDWIDPMHREENATQPILKDVRVPGADAAIGASFFEYRVAGLPRPHYRLLIVVGNQAAIVDVSAGTQQSWKAANPYILTLGSSLHVEAAYAPAPLTAGAGRAVAGLYMGIAPKAMSYLNAVGTYTISAKLFYLFSADGRVYRHYDQLNVPGGNIAYFDFDAAERNDLRNSGRYLINGGKLIIRIEGQQPIITDAPRDGVLTIYGVAYTRQ